MTAMATRSRRSSIIPYTLDANDMRFATPQGFNSGDQFFAYLKDSFDTLYAEGQAGRPRMMNIGLHCRLVGRPGRAAALKRFIDYVKGHDKVWLARRIDIARHWQREPPLPGRRRCAPRAWSETEFVERFGGIFEHSPWIAERAFELELGPAHDSAGGLHNALCRVFRAASEAERLGVLNAHPDLAGKLAAAKRLTRGIGKRTGLRRARCADRRGARALLRAQRRLCRDASAFPSSSRSRARPRTRSWRPSKPASATTARPNSTPPAGRWSASRCCA